jgi:hypothetical protein
MQEPLCGFWTPPGPMDELFDIGALREVQGRVEFAKRMLAGIPSPTAEKAVQGCDEFIGKLDSEVNGRIHELVAKLRNKAA